MIALLAAMALAHDRPVFHVEDIELWDDALARDVSFGVAEAGGLVVVRPHGDAFSFGLSHGAFDGVVRAALDRDTTYDFATIMHSAEVPTTFGGAAAFHLAYNRIDQFGTGSRPAHTPDRDLRAALWMNHPAYWDDWGDGIDQARWVFGQELGHYWLSYVQMDHPTLPADALLGRGAGHWSYFLETGNSPMEGNAWIDNGDGTFTTDRAAGPGGFSALDLYLMGLLPPAEVPPLTYIDTPDLQRTAGAAPEFLRGDADVTVSGAALTITLDQITAVHGPLETAGIAAAPTLLPVLVAGPEEVLTSELIDAVWARLDQWADAWTDMTGGRSSVSFSLVDEGRAPPPLEGAPALVPVGAW